MIDQSERRSVIGCGLPSSGKSTYIGALWHLLQSQELPTRLKYDGLPEDRERLNQLAEKWRRCENMDRTLVQHERIVDIDLRLQDERFRVALPDFSGETWRELWERRICPKSVAELSEQSSGILLFAHADDIIVPLPVVVATEQAKILEAADEVGEQIGAAANGTERPYDAANAPTQAKLVDILQLLSKPPLGARQGRRLAVILSAWDLAADQGQSPSEYLQSHLPLLGQYLENSLDYVDVRIYGISALGGALPQDAEKLRSMVRQSDRITVIEQDGAISHDLTRPLDWLFQ